MTKSLATVLLLATLSTLAISTTARADVHADVEIDPTAYALAGHSLHVGIATGHLRLDLGNFAMAFPQFVHGDDGFDVSLTGYGAKLQYFQHASQQGLFVGADVSVIDLLAEGQDSGLAAHDTIVGVGLHAGYRIALPAGFYVTPWIGVGYQAGAQDITLAGKTYEASPISVFPAIHFGHRFE